VRRALAITGDTCGVSLAGLDSVTISVPGAYDAAADRLSLLGGPLSWGAPGALGAVRAALAPATVLIENNVNLAAVAERAAGVARTADSFAVLWVAAGLGLAIDLGGVLHRGATGGAGEIGYMPVPGGPPERPLDFQDLVGNAAVRALARDHGIVARSGPAAVAKAVAVLETYQRAMVSDAETDAAEAFLNELATRLASGLTVITSVLDPHLVVLSGDTGVAGGRMLAARVQRAMRKISKLRPALMVSGVEGNPALVGALELSLQHTRDALYRASTAIPAITATERPVKVHHVQEEL
jgi:predicted NBD/HSP70 family sugar kinase